MTPQRSFGGLLALTLCASLAGCASAAPDERILRADDVSVRTMTLTEAAGLAEVVAAARELGVASLALAGRDHNVVLSPASLATALAMLAEGARGDSLAELDTALGATGEVRRDAFAALRGSLSALDGDPAAATADELPDRPILHLADQVVVDEGFEVREDYLAALAATFDAGVQHTDLGSDAGKDVLDAWVREHTGGLIEKSAMKPDPDLRVVLQDAVLLAARWRLPFDPVATGERPFTRSDGTIADVETMDSGARTEFAYAQSRGWAGVRLPYTEALHADVLLPPRGIDPADVTAELLADITEALDTASPAPIAVSMPTLDISEDPTDLLPLLPALGLATLPCGAAGTDLSGIALEPGDLCIQQAAQQAVLRVDEEGTVAAAVTELGVAEVSAPLIERELIFDRPFLFTVSHDDTGWPLFLAAVRDPAH